MLHFILIAALAGFGSGSGTGTGGGGGSQFVGVYDGGSGAIQTAAAKVVIDAAGDSSQAGYSKSTQVELTGSGAAGGVVFGDTTQLMSAGAPNNSLIPGLPPSGATNCALPYSDLQYAAVLHFCAAEYNGSSLTPDIGPAPTSYPIAPVVTGASGPFKTGLMGSQANWSFQWNAAANPLGFALDAGFTYFELFTPEPTLPSSVVALAGDFGSSSFEWYVEAGNWVGYQYLATTNAPTLPDGGPNQSVAFTTSNVFKPNVLTGYCAGVGPDGGASIVQICGGTMNNIGRQVTYMPYQFGGTQASTFGIGAQVNLHEVLLSSRPATADYCAQLCQDALGSPHTSHRLVIRSRQGAA